VQQAGNMTQCKANNDSWCVCTLWLAPVRSAVHGEGPNVEAFAGGIIEQSRCLCETGGELRSHLGLDTAMLGVSRALPPRTC
jgi:hypothetical protein